MIIRAAEPTDIQAWTRLRADLWPDEPLSVHRKEAEQLLESSPPTGIVYLAETSEDSLCAFCEASLRRDAVNGCSTKSVAFIEGIYVRPSHRRQGLGRLLIDAVRGWALRAGCKEIASDASLDNTASQAFHRAVGFEETERTVFFRRTL